MTEIPTTACPTCGYEAQHHVFREEGYCPSCHVHLRYGPCVIPEDAEGWIWSPTRGWREPAELLVAHTRLRGETHD